MSCWATPAARTNGADDFDKIHFWRTPVSKCDSQGTCVPYYRWATDYIAMLGGQIGHRPAATASKPPRRGEVESAHAFSGGARDRRPATLPNTRHPALAAKLAVPVLTLRQGEGFGSKRPRPHTEQQHMTDLSLPAVRFRAVSRHFGETRAVDAVDLEIAAGRVLRHARPVRLRQDHLPAADRRLRAARCRHRSRSSASKPRACRPIGAASTPCSRTTPCSRI